MKTLYFASILALAAATTFACNDDEDRVTPRNTAGTQSEAGAAGGDDVSGEGGAAGLGGKPSSSAGGSGTVSGGAAGASGNAAGEAGFAGEPGSAGDAADGGAGGAPQVEPLELIGAYDDNYGSSFVITTDAWGASAIVAYDNALNSVYTQFPADDDFNPNKFAKTLYTEPADDESFYFCMVVYSAATLAEAQASTATADDSDPENGGCGGQFPWTKATRP
jgi:hypothetical protein